MINSSPMMPPPGMPLTTVPHRMAMPIAVSKVCIPEKSILHHFRLNKNLLQLKATVVYPEHSWEVSGKLSTVSEGRHGAKGDSVDTARDRLIRPVHRRIFQ